MCIARIPTMADDKSSDNNKQNLVSRAQDGGKCIVHIYTKSASEIIKFSEQSWKKVCFTVNFYGDKLLISKNIVMIFKLKYQHFSLMNSIAFEKCSASGDTAPNQVVCPK